MNKRVVMLLALLLSAVVSCAKPNQNQIFHLSYPTALSTTHPILATDLTAYNFLHNIHEGLMSYGAGGQVVDGLAQRIDVSADGLIYDIELRPDLKFSDGSGLTSLDVLESWLYALSSATVAPFAHLYDNILGAKAYRLGVSQSVEGLRIIDENRLQVELVRPFFFFQQLLANPSFAVVAAPWREGLEQWDVVSGAYQISQREPDGTLLLAANLHHHAYDEAMLDEVKVSFIGNGELAYQLFKAQELHWQIKNAPLRSVLHDHHQAFLQKSLANGSYFILFNHDRAPYDDVRIRKALSMVVDRVQLASLLDEAPVANSYLTPFNFEREVARANLSAAQELISAAGYTQAKPLVVNYRYSTATIDKNIASYLYEVWSKLVGVEVNLELIEPARYRSLWASGDFDLIRVSWFVSDYEDAMDFLQNFTSDTSFMYSGFSDEYFEDLLSQGANAQTLEQRISILEEAERYLLQDAYATLALFSPVNYHLIDLERWDGVVMSRRDIHPLRFIRPRLGQ